MHPTVQVTGLDWVRGDEQPLAGTTDVKFRSWEDIALESRERFAADLRVMGLPNSIVDQGLELRDTAAESVHKAVADFWAHHEHRYIETPPDVAEQVTEIYNSARWNAWQRLRDWWLQRKVQVESRVPKELSLPLFLVSAPAAAGCSVEFATGAEHEGKIGWSVLISGAVAAPIFESSFGPTLAYVST